MQSFRVQLCLIAFAFHVMQVSVCLGGDSQKASHLPPNIIVIVADDLGYNDLGCMGQTHFATPNLDAMASQGIHFTQFYAGCTVCAPSRACLLTGQHTGHVYQRFNGSVQFREDPLDVTIATRLQNHGYATAMIGKSGLSCNSDDGELPNRKGFDHFMGFTSHGAAHRYYPSRLWRNGNSIQYPNNHGKDGERYSGDLFLTESLEWIENNADHPFFLHLALQQPHADLQVPAKYREKYVGRYEETPSPDGHYRGESHPKATFVGMIDYLDQSVGRVFQKLRELNIDRQTAVFFTSDNGPHYEGGHSPEALDSNGILRGGKRDLYEGGIRVPLLVRWPARIEAGRTSSHISAFWDLPATFCELAGIEIPSNFDGISLVPTLTGSAKQTEHKSLYWEFYERGGKQAVRVGKWKAVRLNVSQDPNGPIELYDLDSDPGETTDVAAEHPEMVRQMITQMAEAHVPSESISFANGPVKPSQRIGKRLTGVHWMQRDQWKVVDVSSESNANGRTIDKVIDGNPSSHWHTFFQGRAPTHPHWFVIDLGKPCEIHAAGLLSRQDGNRNGLIHEIEIQVSDSLRFDQSGDLFELKDSIDEQHIELSRHGRYVKVIAHSEHDGKRYASLAEINFAGK